MHKETKNAYACLPIVVVWYLDTMVGGQAKLLRGLVHCFALQISDLGRLSHSGWRSGFHVVGGGERHWTWRWTVFLLAAFAVTRFCVSKDDFLARYKAALLDGLV